LAYDIQENLPDLGVLVDSRKVFIIYGHDCKAEGTTRQLREWLCDKGVKVVLLDAVRSSTGILPDLMRDMNACAAFIAICTPDDYCEEGLSRGNRWWQPRENVLFEMVLSSAYIVARIASRSSKSG
jgi:predicted nucleotide-binding protein